jgi:WD40 repeat protein
VPQRTIADIRLPTAEAAADDLAHGQTIELPANGAAGESIDIRVLSTSELTGAGDTFVQAPPGDKPATVSFGPEQTIEFAGSGTDPDATMLTSQWQSGIARGHGDPSATIKQKETISGAHGSSSSLIVKSRHVRPTGSKTPAQATSPADAPDYELLNVIGEGGMGVVYAARQSSIARTVALKMLKTGEADASQRDKFISEAVVTGELDHPNIVPIYDLGANDEGALFYSMKRVKGTPWNKVIKEKSLDDNLGILLRVADAVAFAHVNGVLHRDLKPENVMLGDFGEVLVMDWGLARVNSQFPSAASVTQSDAMGGTPAYMAPEMATGPLDHLSAASDVYLLGAILYEIVTGRPPHTGKSVMACLFAAAKNQITPTDKSGELVDVALKAMATKPEERHASVQDFQAAIREYQAHAESLQLLRHARENLDEAAEKKDYDLYARALYALEESIALWPGNTRAAALLDSARLEYARLALAKGDFDLGASLLDSGNEAHREILAELELGRRERTSRQRWFKVLKGAVAALAAVVVGVVSVAYVAVSRERDEAVFQRDRAVVAEANAQENFQQAEDARKLEAIARQEAEEETKRAVAAEALAEDRRKETERRRLEAVEARDAADRARKDEAYAAYVARIGLAKAKLDENAFDRAIALLEECPEELRNWEWGRLRYLTELSKPTWSTAAPVDAAAFSPDGVHFATGGWDGNAAIWNVRTGQRERVLPQGQYVHAVAYDADGERLAAGSSDGTVNIYRAADGQRIAQLLGHEDAVLSVRFSPDGKRLLTCGYDETARLWDLETSRLLQVLDGHSWWVWSAEFSPDGNRIVTAGQDGKAIVWARPASADRAGDANIDAPYTELAEFTEHKGPVYAAAFSPSDGHVATGGADGRVLLWDPDEIPPVDYDRLIQGLPVRSAPHRELAGHRGPVRTLAFDTDGITLVSGAEDNAIFIWNVAAAAPLKQLRGHASHVRSCVFSPDGRWLLSAGRDAQIKLWRPEAYAEKRELRTDPDVLVAILSARFSSDGTRVLTASKDRTASLWDAASLDRVQRFAEGHDFLATSAAFFADRARLATAAGDGTTRIWNLESGAEILRLEGTGPDAALDVSDDGALIATASGASEAFVWDADSGEKLDTLVGHDAAITAVRFAPGGELLATGDQYGRCRLWKLNSNNRTWVGGHWLRHHSRRITALAFANQGERLITASEDNTCGQWDVATGEELTDLILRHPDRVADMVLSRDGQFVLTGCDDGAVRLWSLADAQVRRTLSSGDGVTAFTAVDLSSDGRLAAGTCSSAGEVQVWDLTTGQELSNAGDGQAGRPWLEVPLGRGAVWAARFAPDNSHLLVLGGNDARLFDIGTRQVVMRFSPHGVVASADVSHDGTRVVTGSWDRTAKIWDAATGHVVAKLEALHSDFINSVAFSPDGSRILTASDDGTARLWDAATGQALDVVLRGHTGAIRQACYSPNGKRILTASADKTARLWDADTGAELASLVGHAWTVRCAAFSADGRFVVTGSDDNSAIVWDAVTGEPRQTLAGHTGAVTAVALSADGSRALTGSQDATAKLWDAVTGKEILTLAGHDNEVTSASFSPDGLQALTSGAGGRVLIWPAVDWKGRQRSASTER